MRDYSGHISPRNNRTIKTKMRKHSLLDQVRCHCSSWVFVVLRMIEASSKAENGFSFACITLSASDMASRKYVQRTEWAINRATCSSNPPSGLNLVGAAEAILPVAAPLHAYGAKYEPQTNSSISSGSLPHMTSSTELFHGPM